MMKLLFVLFVVFSGAMLSVQAAVNGRLSQSVGVLRSALLTFTVGAIVTALLIVFFEPSHELSLLEMPKWQLCGALFGVFYMVVMVAAVPVIGVATATVAVIFGQLAMGMLIDLFGWLGNEALPLSINHMAAACCLLGALWLMSVSNNKTKG